MNANLTTAYRFWRASPSPMPASLALVKARQDIAAGIKRHTRSSKAALASYQNAPNERGGRWIENPEGAGLRFVGWSDELRQTRNSYRGWFLYPDGDPGELARGCVYQLPSRGGQCLFVEAMRTGEYSGSDWHDMGEQGGAVVFLNAVHRDSARDYEDARDMQGAREAARGADREAEIYAEHEREYHEAWYAGKRAAELREEAKAERAAARELVAELRDFYRSGFKLPPAVCQTLRAGIRAHIRDASEATRKANAIKWTWCNVVGRLADAFNEGAAS